MLFIFYYWKKEGKDGECLESEASAFQKFLHIFLFPASYSLRTKMIFLANVIKEVEKSRRTHLHECSGLMTTWQWQGNAFSVNRLILRMFISPDYT